MGRWQRDYDDGDITSEDYERSFMGEDDGGRGGKKHGGGGGGFYRRKICRFCTDNEMVLDYKNIRTVQSFMTEHGKIVPRRISGNCAFHQRQMTTAIKRARQLALVGYTSLGN